jgi:hypothetical protein
VARAFIFGEGLLIAVAMGMSRPSTQEYRFIHIISAPLAERTVFNRETWLYGRDVRLVARDGSAGSKM